MRVSRVALVCWLALLVMLVPLIAGDQIATAQKHKGPGPIPPELIPHPKNPKHVTSHDIMPLH